MVNVASEPGSASPVRDSALRARRGSPSGVAQGLSIVVPLHNEAASLQRLHAELAEVARTLGANTRPRLRSDLCR